MPDTGEGWARVAQDEVELKERRGGGAGSRDIAGAVGAEQMKVRVWRFGPGNAMPYHRHEVQEELYHLLAGGPQPLQVRDEILQVADGDWIRVARDVPRRITNDTDRDAHWLVIAAPPGQGILDGVRLDPETGEVIPRT